MVEEKHKALRAPGTQKKKKKAGIFWKAIKNYIKKSTLSELQFFPACPEGSQNRGQSGMFEIKKKKKKSLLLFWLEEPPEKKPRETGQPESRGRSQERKN